MLMVTMTKPIKIINMTKRSLKNRYILSGSIVSIHSRQFEENINIFANTLDSHVFPADFPLAIDFYSLRPKP
jgi:hypothetical protein